MGSSFCSSLPPPDVTLSPWSGDKCHQRRVLTYTIPISNPLGPKSASVVETQVGRVEGQAGQLWGLADGGPDSSLLLVSADAVPAWPPGGRLCGGLGGADPGHPLPGLLLHGPPLLHPGPRPQQGPAPVSGGPSPDRQNPLSPSPGEVSEPPEGSGLSQQAGAAVDVDQDGERWRGMGLGDQQELSLGWAELSLGPCVELGYGSKKEGSGPGAGSAAGVGGPC